MSSAPRQDFADATILVTGAASGIGAATARLLRGSGARLILLDRHPTELEGLPGIDCLLGDVADPDLWARADLSRLTHAVLNAGIAGTASAIADMSFAHWRSVLATNLDGTFLGLGAVMRALRARGGSVVVSASISGLKAQPNIAHYAASKAAIVQLVKVAALEGAAHGIRVNAIAPAGVETPIWSDQPFFRELADEKGGEAEAYRAIAAQSMPLGRFARAEEVAAQIAFLLSDACATVTGSCFVNDGGFSL